MADKRAFLLEAPGDPCSDYLRAALPLARRPETADALVVPTLAPAAAGPLANALAAGKPALLPREALPEVWSGTLRRSLSFLTGRGLIICPLTELPRWVRSGASCPFLLTLERLKAFVAQGFDRIYLTNRPAATPLAEREAKRLNIHLTGGVCPGIGKSDRLGMVYQKK